MNEQATISSKSEEIYLKLKEDIPGGVNSPVRSFPNLGIGPMIVESGQGALIKDIEGKEYIDYCGSWGALIHGHAHPEIVNVAQNRIALGSTFGITTQIEGKLASKVKSFVPSIEKIRFVSSGTEATMSAIRLARAFTGKNLILKFSGNYHGHSDAFLMQAGSGVFSLNAQSTSAGVLQDCIKNTLSLPYNDEESFINCFDKYKDQIACVILEPIAGNMGLVPAKKSFISLLREKTLQSGAVLIFDEVITGFRVSKEGAQGFYPIQPDLTCFGKIIGGGFPAAAFGGKKQIMDLLAPLGPVYQAGTLSGNPVAMEAGYKALELLDVENFYHLLEEKTKIITKPIKQFILENEINACIQEVGSMFTLFFGKRSVVSKEDAMQLDTTLFAKFFRYLFEKGIYWVPSQFEACFVSASHTQFQLDYTKDAILSFLQEVY